MAAKLVARGSIKAAIATKSAKQLEKVGLTAEMVKERLRLIAFQDIRELFDEAGNLLPVKTLPDHVAPMVAGVEVMRQRAKVSGETAVIEDLHKVKVVDPVRALEMLAKHFGLLIDKVEHSGEIALPTKVIFELHRA